MNRQGTRYFRDEGWPTAEERILLDAVLGDGDVAREAWRHWRDTHDADRIDVAALHVIPPLYLNLRRLGLDGETPQRVREIYHHTWARNQLALRTVGDVARTLAAHDIDVLAMKGVPLLLERYTDPGARMVNDIDLLVREEQVLPAFRVLLEAGWTFRHPRPGPDHIPFINSVALQRPQASELDLHWRPLTIDCARDREEAMWARATQREVHGSTVFLPDLTDQILLWCLHARRPDKQATCRWVVDASVLIDPTDFDHETLIERARMTGLLLPMFDTLLWLHDVRGHEHLAPVAEQADRHEPTQAETTRYEQIMHEPIPERGIGDIARTLWWRYSGSNRARGRPIRRLAFVRYLFRHFQRVWDLPAWRVPLRLGRECLRPVRFRPAPD